MANALVGGADQNGAEVAFADNEAEWTARRSWAGGLRSALERILSDKYLFRSDEPLGLAYKRAREVTDDTIEAYLRPFLSLPQRLHDLERFLAGFDCKQTARVEPQLRALKAPTLIVWATDDIFSR